MYVLYMFCTYVYSNNRNIAKWVNTNQNWWKFRKMDHRRDIPARRCKNKKKKEQEDEEKEKEEELE